jgi:flagellin
MSLNWGSNTAALTLSHYLNNINAQLNKSLERITTNSKLNHASDGPAMIQVSENLTSQIRGYDMASSNSQQGLSMLQTADDSLQQINTHLQNIRDIAAAASSAPTTPAQFAAYQASVQAELGAIDNISSSTKYGTNVLLDGSISGGAGFNIQVGPNSGDRLDIKSAFTNNVSGAGGLSVTQTTLTSNGDASTLLTQVDAAIATATSNLAKIGGYENRLSDQINYLSIAKVNTTDAQMSIRNTDVAAETANIARLQVMQQAGAYALSQTNQFPSLLLKLLQL